MGQAPQPPALAAPAAASVRRVQQRLLAEAARAAFSAASQRWRKRSAAVIYSSQPLTRYKLQLQICDRFTIMYRTAAMMRRL